MIQDWEKRREGRKISLNGRIAGIGHRDYLKAVRVEAGEVFKAQDQGKRSVRIPAQRIHKYGFAFCEKRC